MSLGNFIEGVANKATGNLTFNSNPNQARDDAFANSGLNEEFRDQFNSIWDAYNPDSISDTFWDKFSNFFGARSSADKTRLQLEQARKEQIAQLVGLSREQTYNSEEEKAKRMRAAGINPDLQGLGDASEASEMSEPEQRPDFGMLSSGKDIASGFSNALTTALSLYAGVQGLRSTGLDIASKEIEQAVGSEDNFFNILKSVFKPDDLRNYLDPASDLYGKGWTPDMKDIFSERTLKDLGIRSKRARKMLSSRVDTFLGSMSAEIKKYKTFDEWLESQDKYAKTASSWFRPNGADSTDDEIVSGLKIWNDALHDLEVKYNNFQRTYYATLSAKKYAEAENAANNFRKFATEKKQELYKRLLGDKGNEKTNMFRLLLATSLMTDSNVIGNGLNMINSGIDIGKHFMPGLGAENAGKLLKLAL